MLEQMFKKEKIEKIIRIPISMTGRLDTINWKNTKHWVYVAKSRCDLAKQQQNTIFGDVGKSYLGKTKEAIDQTQRTDSIYSMVNMEE